MSFFGTGAYRRSSDYDYQVTLGYWWLLWLNKAFRTELLALFEELQALGGVNDLPGPCALPDLPPPLKEQVEAALLRFRQRWPMPQPQGGLIDGWREVLWKGFWVWRKNPDLARGTFILSHGTIPLPVPEPISPPRLDPFLWHPAFDSEEELDRLIRNLLRQAESDMRQQAEAARRQVSAAGWKRPSGQQDPFVWSARLYGRYVERLTWPQLAEREAQLKEEHERLRRELRKKGKRPSKKISPPRVNVRPESLATKVKAWARRLGLE
jgi:hypothetical protein